MYLVIDTRTDEIVWRCQCEIRARQCVDIFNEETSGAPYILRKS